MKHTSGALREEITIQSPATTQTRDDYGHPTDAEANYDDQGTIWANVEIKEDLSAEINVWHSTESTPITSLWRIKRADASKFIVKGAFDADGTRRMITITAEPE